MAIPVAVLFKQIYPSAVIEVPMAEAWSYYERRAGALDLHFKVRLDNGSETFAQAVETWDFSEKRTRLLEIGLGASSRKIVRNPSIPEAERVRRHEVDGNYISGINFGK